MTEIPEYADCSWPVDPACFEDSWDDLDEDVRDRALALASSTLRRLTGYRVGGCPVTVRPCRPGCNTAGLPFYGGPSWGPSLTVSGSWVNSCGCKGASCICDDACSVKLPGPIGRVDKVMVNGEELETDDYRIIGTQLLWAGEGDCPFPTCQDMTLPDTEEGTMSVTYLNAYPVDGLGAYAAGVLTMEYAKACTGAKCRLPLGITNIARQGVSFQLETGAFPSGMTGIREVDAFIALWNPQGLMAGPQVWSPGKPRPSVVR